MLAYERQPRNVFGLTTAEWSNLSQFLQEIQEIINTYSYSQRIESPPPEMMTTGQSTEEVFSPNGWVGRYPGGIQVTPNPDKINEFEYKKILSDLAGWLELWDIPTAATSLPILQTETLERRRVLVGYSKALSLFTEEALAHRPPVSVSRQSETGLALAGSLDTAKTVQTRANGSREIAYQKVQFSLDHPLNLLLLRFHAELQQELDQLIDESIIVDSILERNRAYHKQFIETEFPTEMLDRALQVDFADPSVLDRARRESPDQLTELVTLWESYQRDQALSIALDQRLTIGLKPIEKVYELWILTVLIECLEDILGTTVGNPTEDLEKVPVTSDITLHYNRPLEEFSRLLVPDLMTNPGRPDYALSVADEVVWIGDAKYQHRDAIDLPDYQRLFSYMIDLIPADSGAATLFYPSTTPQTNTATVPAYNVTELGLRPKNNEIQRPEITRELRACLSEQ